MDRSPTNWKKPAWFAALIALVVALGTQLLLESIVPADWIDMLSATDKGSATISRMSPDFLWISGTVIRFLSFALGGFVAVSLAGAPTKRLLGMLFAAAVLATLFQQFPGAVSLVFVTFWSLAAPVAAIAGAWIAGAKRRAV